MMTLSHSAGITQLEFHQAMNDFKTMFPEMDEDVIEMVLRANNGAVDATIDQLLLMNMDSENERIRNEPETTAASEVPPRYSPATPPPSYQQAVPSVPSPLRSTRQPHESNHKSNQILSPIVMSSTFENRSLSKDSMRFQRNWNPPLIGSLPGSFLRVEPDENQRKIASASLVHNHTPSKVTRLNSAILQQKMEENERQRQLSFSHDDPELSQYLEDERFAIFLQNEEFVNELRRNKDFMSTLEVDSSAGAMRNNSSGAEGSTHLQSDAAFKETLKHMGKMSRRKFAQLARLFSGRKRKSFQHLTNEATNPSRDNLLVCDDEYTQFQNEGSDVEDYKETDSHSKQQVGSSLRKNL